VPLTRDTNAESGARLLPVCVEPSLSGTSGFGKMQVAQLQQECTRLEQLAEDLERQLVMRTGKQTDSQDRSSLEQQHLSASGAQLTDSIEGSQPPVATQLFLKLWDHLCFLSGLEQEHTQALQQLTYA
jgi:hypothetical protein